ncbi:MAG: hypothetical protein AAB538_01325, partial [Patescibacteria group bacterium]
MNALWRRHIVVLILYVVLTVFMTMPIVSNISTHVAGLGGDPWQTMWRFGDEWDNANILEIFGGGEPRLVNISVWPWMWLHLMFGQPAAYNLVYLLSFVLSGYFMYLLVRFLTRRVPEPDALHRYGGGLSRILSEAPAFLAGVLYMFLPYHVAHGMGHFGAMQTQWLPLAVLLLFMWIQRPTVWRTIGLALVVTLQSWSEHHYLLWLAIFVVVFAIFHLIRPEDELASPSQGEAPLLRKERSAERWVRWIRGNSRQIVLLSILLITFAALPWWPMVRLAAQPSDTLSLGIEQTIRFSADLFSFVTPPQWQPIWGGIAYELFGKHFTGNIVEATQFLGFLPLLLLIFFRQHVLRREKKFWFAVAAIFFLISLGPRLHVFGNVLPMPLPYALLDSLPVFSAVRAVARAGVVVGLSVSVLFGWILATQLKRPISVAVALAVILTEFLFLPVPLQATKLSGAYEIISSLPGKALVEIPAATNYTAASESLYASRVHKKEVVGNIALERALEKEVFAEAKSLPALRQLLFLRTAHILENRPEFFAQGIVETLPDTLRYLDVSAIAVRADSLSAEQRQAIDYFLHEQLGWPGEKYEDVVLYKVQPRAGDGVFLSRDGRWENVGFDPKRESTFAEIPRQAAVTLYNVRETNVTVTLEFDVEQGAISVSMAGTPLRQGYAGQGVRVPIVLEPGKQEVVFESLLPDKAI